MAKSRTVALSELRGRPDLFRAGLSIDTSAGAVPLAKRIDPWQEQDYRALDRAWLRVAGRLKDRGSTPVTRAWLERPRGHSKTTDLAVQVCYVLMGSYRKITGVAAAADADQARLLVNAIDGLVRVNPFVADFLEVQNSKVVNKHTGSELVVISSDAKTSYGLTPDFVICDEVTHWKNEDLWVSLLSAAAKREHCLLIVITNAGFSESWQWETRQAIVECPDEWYFRHLDGPHASWITPAKLAEQRRLLPEIAYRRLWLNEWSSGSGDALKGDDIAAAVTLDRAPAGPEPGWWYAAGLDLGLSRDHAALVVVGRHVGHVEEIPGPEPVLSLVQMAMIENKLQDPPERPVEYREFEGTGRLRLAAVRVWEPPVGGRISLVDVESEVDRVCQHFDVSLIGADPWQSAQMTEQLRGIGHAIESCDFVAGNLKSMASATLEAFNEGRIDLFSDDRLLRDLRKLRIVEKSYGVRLESPRGPDGHGDVATAFAIALHLHRKHAGEGVTPTWKGELVLYP